MEPSKRARLESKEWKIGTVSDFLELTPEETILVEIKLALSQSLKERRQNLMTQSELATKINSSQPRIANAENGSLHRPPSSCVAPTKPLTPLASENLAVLLPMPLFALRRVPSPVPLTQAVGFRSVG